MRAFGREIRFGRGRMRRPQRRPEGGPLALRQQRRVHPLAELRHHLQRALHGAGERLAGEAGRHRIDRLDHRQLLECLAVDDMVGMDHLRPAVEPFDAAADIADRPDRHHAFEKGRLGMEENERDLAAVVVREDAVGLLAVSGRRRHMPVDAKLERHDRAFGRAGDARLVAAVDDRRRQMEEEIDDARQAGAFLGPEQAADRLADFRTDPGKARHVAKERVEDVGAHGAFCLRPPSILRRAAARKAKTLSPRRLRL